MAFDHGRTGRAAVTTISLGRAAAVLEHREALGGTTLDGRSRLAPLDAAHLEAATAARGALNLHALATTTAAVGETEPVAATATLGRALDLHALAATATAARLSVAATATGSLSGAIAAISTTMFAGLGARRRRNRQSGDTRG